MQRRERGVQHLTCFQSGQGRRVDAHPLGDVGQRESLAFPYGLEPRHQGQNGRETLPIDCMGRPLPERIAGVMAPHRFFLCPLLGGSLWPRDWLHGFSGSACLWFFGNNSLPPFARFCAVSTAAFSRAHLSASKGDLQISASCGARSKSFKSFKRAYRCSGRVARKTFTMSTARTKASELPLASVQRRPSLHSPNTCRVQVQAWLGFVTDTNKAGCVSSAAAMVFSVSNLGDTFSFSSLDRFGLAMPHLAASASSVRPRAWRISRMRAPTPEVARPLFL